ncbi:AfsR/SARP family transcriptional regulator [Saccharothrix longispora]|uniref:AfsR/SARP family transcriptional regulator n=1 Tax=Saccharothrix longispora TaxID=33920 RepID=UPI0028FD2627|nr:AfsR/SARP family transcriptional regulator [Saccharothrix longispora]MDU0289333.1 AfsR/SARP family transcriptional regulator [Saccharothrix longispora]
MRIEIVVLGPLAVDLGGVSVVPTASKPSQLLAVLALNAGRVVTADALIKEIWVDSPPRTAVSTLRTYVLKLRRNLDTALGNHGGLTSKDILITRRTGYLLNVEPSAVDAFRYEELSAAGRQAVNEGDHERASRTLAEALRLWRGPALADVPLGPQLAIEAMRLGENRLGDLYLRIEADLALGRHHQLLGELATLCARYPMQENFHVQHMVALYRSGRQSQALAVYRRLRDEMVEQSGVEPSPWVRQLHRAILTGQASVEDRSVMFKA